jgi:hypothetical protein
MHLAIERSVGNKGLNKIADVELIQTLLNCYIKQFTPSLLLVADGKCGKKTIDAITIYQGSVLKLKRPDGRVDPNGKTFNTLTMAYKAEDQKKIAEHQNRLMSWDKLFTYLSPKIKAQGALIYRMDNYIDFKVTYKANIKKSDQLVSEYSKKVIKMALKDAGMPAAVITSTLRSPKEQASIMYKNAKINYQDQIDMYGRTGDKVLKVYKDNSAKDKDTVISLMEQKIIDLLKVGNRTSKHCVTADSYKKLNIIDIGVYSTKSVCGKEFHKTKFTNALKHLKSNGFIEEYIDETKKSNACWHVEIIPNKKSTA